MNTGKQNSNSTKTLREFGFLTGAIFIAFFGLLLPWIKKGTFPLWPYAVAITLWVPALLMPKILAPVYTAWMKVGHILGWVNTRIILGVFFYFVITPLGLVKRLMSADPMNRRFDANLKSYREPTSPMTHGDLEKPF